MDAGLLQRRTGCQGGGDREAKGNRERGNAREGQGAIGGRLLRCGGCRSSAGGQVVKVRGHTSSVGRAAAEVEGVGGNGEAVVDLLRR